MANINRNKQHTNERTLSDRTKKTKMHTIFWSSEKTEEFFHISKDVKVFSNGTLNIPQRDPIIEQLGLLSGSAQIHIPGDNQEPIEIKTNCDDLELLVQATSTNNVATFVYSMEAMFKEYTYHGLLDWKLKSVSYFNKSFASINGSFIIAVNTNPRVLYLGGYFDIEQSKIFCCDFLWKLSIPLITLQNSFPELVGDRFFSTGKAGANLEFSIPDTLGEVKSGWRVMRCQFPKKPDGSGTFAIVGHLK